MYYLVIDIIGDMTVGKEREREKRERERLVIYDVGLMSDYFLEH